MKSFVVCMINIIHFQLFVVLYIFVEGKYAYADTRNICR